jgi:Zn finger protein HypA/HybF involved in hydrogenase expression
MRPNFFRSAFVAAALLLGGSALAQENSECLDCHEDHDLKGTRRGKPVSVYVDAAKIKSSIHASVDCVDCHADLAGKELPHEDDLKPAACGSCHEDIQTLHAKSLHGKAIARGDPLAPRCQDCHGSHAVVRVKDPRSPVTPLRVPFLCGKCHQEGSPVQRQRTIHQDHILENFSESIHV